MNIISKIRATVRERYLSISQGHPWGNTINPKDPWPHSKLQSATWNSCHSRCNSRTHGNSANLGSASSVNHSPSRYPSKPKDHWITMIRRRISRPIHKGSKPSSPRQRPCSAEHSCGVLTGWVVELVNVLGWFACIMIELLLHAAYAA